MHLTQRIKEEFEDQDRDGGDDYFNSERVRIVDERRDYIAALVDGSDDSYFVQFDFSDIPAGNMAASCDCRRFAGGTLCKHLWATARALEEHHYFSQMQGTNALHIFRESPDALIPGPANQSKKKGKTVVQRNGSKRPAGSTTTWRGQLSDLRMNLEEAAMATIPVTDEIAAQKKQHWFVLSVSDQNYTEPFTLQTYQSTRKKNGEWGKPVLRYLGPTEAAKITDDVERRILTLIGPRETGQFGGPQQAGVEIKIPRELIDDVIPQLCETGRFVWTQSSDRSLDESTPIGWDDGDPWQLSLSLAPVAENEDQMRLSGTLIRGDDEEKLENVVAVTRFGLILFQSKIARLQNLHADWINILSKDGHMVFPAMEINEFVDQVTAVPGLPTIHFDEPLEIGSVEGNPGGLLAITNDEHNQGRSLKATVFVRYGNREVTLDDARQCFWDPAERTIVRRNIPAERALLKELSEYPFQVPTNYYYEPGQLTLPTKFLAKVVTGMTEGGWEVVAHGKTMRSPTDFSFEVTSNQDWFDLNATVQFGDLSAPFPALLKAVRNKQQFITLSDGTQGLLPEGWLARYEKFARLGQEHEDSLRFTSTQAIMLDAMLAEQEMVTVDRSFTELIEKLNAFKGIDPVDEPENFTGELRPYQRDGLGWLEFLREFQFGGCLADDMGLGKTVQVLAMLQSRKSRNLEANEKRYPSIVIVPKSLVFNWIDEASRFTTNIKVLNYTGMNRGEVLDSIQSCDILVTTYGTLRRDIAELKEIQFDYAILDESQAIKNSSSQAFKACRLLKASHRLAMTGTPIENHLGELWSLFEFLNPGMMGSMSGFKKIVGKDRLESLEWLSNALKPFILRRTKVQVLTDLPEKIEQTLHCELSTRERELYDELRDFFRSNIGSKVGEVGLNKAKIHVLQALMRLRQAACDPRLLDKEYGETGSKIELLTKQLTEVLAEGHKALVFSQFTSLLALVRQEVEKQQWNYEYLDGKTRKRAECVKRFQENEDCQLFLISLKAGGHGLNLTAADYVFILDPWWNPAVEAQAIDRAHRIGQTRSVMAYRIIAQDTVEEKIVELQKTKQELADAIISADESLISNLSLDDLQLLFG